MFVGCIDETFMSNYLRKPVHIDEISSIQNEFEQMVTVLGRLSFLDKLPGNANGMASQTIKLIQRTEGLIATYSKRKMQLNRTSVYLRPLSYMKLRILLFKLQPIKGQVIDVKQKWKNVEAASKAESDPVQPGELQSGTSSVTSGSDAININKLPTHLRQLLYYFLLFPANFEIPIRRIIVLWAAEGCLDQRNDLDSDQDAAYGYLEMLMEQNMVFGKTKKTNRIYRACKLNEHMRDTLSARAKEERFFQNTPEELYRLVDHHGTSDSCFIHIHGNPGTSSSLKKYRSVLSFMSFNTQEGNKPGEDRGNFLRKCISAGCFLELRILDLEKLFRPKLPETLCNLTLLKYLGLRWTYLQHLPKYMDKLLNLQVLDVKHTYISALPRSIWRMQFLRHLYLSETYGTRFVGRPSDASLVELQTLWGAFIDENTHVRKGLDTARNIKKLGLSCRSSSSESSHMSEQLKSINDWISKLDFLQVLRLKSRDVDGKASELHLKPLTNYNLSTIYLLGKLERSVVFEFPVNLIDITLSGSELNVDPMMYLGKLKGLNILRLLSQSVMCRSMHCSKGDFPRLRVLKIWNLENLEEWKVEKPALSYLEHLEIRSCTKLTMLPVALQHIRTLKECILTSMPKQFVDETEDKINVWNKIKLLHKIKLESNVDEEPL